MRNFLFIVLLSLCTSTFAAHDIYQFKSHEQQTRFYNLTKNLRCLVCQNQNLAESNAGLANDLRDEIFLKVNTGFTDPQIIQYLVARYGDFILYKPPVSNATLILWFAPLAFLLCGLSILFLYLRQKPRPMKQIYYPSFDETASSFKIGDSSW